MKKAIAVGIASVFVFSGPVLADDQKSSETKPVTLTEKQMDSITAAGNAYGKTIIEVAGASFGQLVGTAKSSGTAAHSNYAGGAKALVETVCVHVPTACQ